MVVLLEVLLRDCLKLPMSVSLVGVVVLVQIRIIGLERVSELVVSLLLIVATLVILITMALKKPRLVPIVHHHLNICVTLLRIIDA